MNWNEIRNCYVNEDTSISGLVRQFGVSRYRIVNQAKKDGWDEARRQRLARQAEEAEVHRKQQEDQIDALMCRLLDRAVEAVEQLDCVVQSCREKEKTDKGEVVREYEQIRRDIKGIVDRGGLRQLTTVAKDILEMWSIQPELDRQEQEAKLQKLIAELEQRDGDNQILVSLAPEILALAE